MRMGKPRGLAAGFWGLAVVDKFQFLCESLSYPLDKGEMGCSGASDTGNKPNTV